MNDTLESFRIKHKLEKDIAFCDFESLAPIDTTEEVDFKIEDIC
jgi:hypothetical protein